MGEGFQHEAVVIIGEEDGEALHLARHAARLGQLQALLLRGSRQNYCQEISFVFRLNDCYFFQKIMTVTPLLALQDAEHSGVVGRVFSLKY